MSKFKSGFFFLIFIWFWAFMTQNAGYECLLDKHFSGFDVIVHIFASEKLILWVKNSHALSIQNCKVFIPHCGWSGMYYATIFVHLTQCDFVTSRTRMKMWHISAGFCIIASHLGRVSLQLPNQRSCLRNFFDKVILKV